MVIHRQKRAQSNRVKFPEYQTEHRKMQNVVPEQCVQVAAVCVVKAENGGGIFLMRVLGSRCAWKAKEGKRQADGRWQWQRAAAAAIVMSLLPCCHAMYVAGCHAMHSRHVLLCMGGEEEEACA